MCAPAGSVSTHPSGVAADSAAVHPVGHRRQSRTRVGAHEQRHLPGPLVDGRAQPATDEPGPGPGARVGRRADEHEGGHAVGRADGGLHDELAARRVPDQHVVSGGRDPAEQEPGEGLRGGRRPPRGTPSEPGQQDDRPGAVGQPVQDVPRDGDRQPEPGHDDQGRLIAPHGRLAGGRHDPAGSRRSHSSRHDGAARSRSLTCVGGSGHAIPRSGSAKATETSSLGSCTASMR